jgi:hypothetical protein
MKALIFANKKYKEMYGEKIDLKNSYLDRIFLKGNSKLKGVWFDGNYADRRDIVDSVSNLLYEGEIGLFSQAATYWRKYIISRADISNDISFYDALAQQLGYQKLRTLKDGQKPWNELAKDIVNVDEDIYNSGLKIPHTTTTLRAKFALSAQYMRDTLVDSNNDGWDDDELHTNLLKRFINNPEDLNKIELNVLIKNLNFNFRNEKFTLSHTAGAFRLARLAFDMELARASDYNYFSSEDPSSDDPYSAAACINESGAHNGVHKYPENRTTFLCTPDITNKQLLDGWYKHKFETELNLLRHPDTSGEQHKGLLMKLINIVMLIDGLGVFELFEAAEMESLAYEGSVLEEEAAIAEEEYISSACEI